jgi:hypothetical protein
MNYKEYTTTYEKVWETLEKYGVATIPNVLEEKECIDIRNKMWKEFEHVTQNRFQLDDSTTWKHFYDLFPLHSMLFQHWSLGQTQPVWDVRQNKNVGKVFENIWKKPKEDLLVSFDGISIHLPPEITKRGWYRGTEWLHTDQAPIKKGYHCIQGFINMYPVNEGDATLSVLEGSHKYHEEFFESIGMKDEKEDWYKMKDKEPEFFKEKGCERTCVKAGIGSMVLWDSRTMHQGIEAFPTRKEENYRMVVYVCMMPREGVSKKILEKRVNAFENRRLTNHWANNPKLFPKIPRTYGKEVPKMNEITKVELNEYGKRLVGYI